VVPIDGTGFSSASVEIQAASLASVLVVSPEQIHVTLAAPTEIAGKRVRVRDPLGETVDFYPSWTGGPLSTSPSTAPSDPYVNAIPIFPLQTYLQATAGGSTRVDSGWIAVQNPNQDSVDVSCELEDPVGDYQSTIAVKIPAGGSYYQNVSTLGIPLENRALVLASAPVRMLGLTSYTNHYSVPPYLPQKSVGPLAATSAGPRFVAVYKGSLAWSWQTGGARPAVQTFQVFTQRTAVGLTPADLCRAFTAEPSRLRPRPLACDPRFCRPQSRWRSP
jgi:hypothetical protein